MENQVLSFEEIKKMFPNEWVLLGNPEYSDTDILSGVVIMHNKDKGHIVINRPNWWDNFSTGPLPKPLPILQKGKCEPICPAEFWTSSFQKEKLNRVSPAAL